MSDTADPTAADWAGLCALTETSRPEEQLYVLWVIRNRAESGKFGHGYQGVVLAPSQFSAFNLWTVHKLPNHETSPRDIYNAVAARYGDSIMALLEAGHLAERVLDSGSIGMRNSFITHPGWSAPYEKGREAPLNPWKVCHYYSPISMKPAGSKPAWADSARLLFTPPGIDPQRFVFAEGVP